MAASYKKTIIKSYPKVGEKITRDTLYWKNLEFPITRKEFGAVTRVHFSSAKPYNFAVTSSSKVQVFGCENCELLKIITRFKATGYGGSFRGDGKLLVAGMDNGMVKLFDSATKSILRIFKGHSRCVQMTQFVEDNLHVMSGSDDKTIRIWDVPTEAQVIRYDEHQDYIRCGDVSQASKDIVVTGSYDHKIKMFDIRTDSSVLTMDHGQPVQSVLLYPSGGLLVSAGGTSVKVWDVLAGGKLLTTLNNHHKEVTTLTFASNHNRLLSGGLDRLVKIYDVSTYQVVHTLDYPSAILSLGVAPDDSTLVVGMADGLLSMQHRKSEMEMGEAEMGARQRKKKEKVSFRYATGAKTYVPMQDDFVVAHERKVHLSKYDRFFKKFEHSKALDAALDLRIRTKQPQVTVSVFLELIRRGAIKSALAGRDEKSLSVIFKFIQKNITNPKYVTVLTDVSNLIIDLYADQVGSSPAMDELLVRLKDTVDVEVNYLKQLYELMGTMDTIFSASQKSKPMDSLVENQLKTMSLTPSATALAQEAQDAS